MLSLFLVITSDHLLRISGPMWWISVGLCTLITFTVIAVALGFGALYADFKAENRAAALGGLGAILFLFTAMTFELLVIAVGAVPTYHLTLASLRGMAPRTVDLVFLFLWLLASVLAAVLLAVFTLRKGIKKLAESG
jgi:ABC-2 type transport system permease protein